MMTTEHLSCHLRIWSAALLCCERPVGVAPQLDVIPAAQQPPLLLEASGVVETQRVRDDVRADGPNRSIVDRDMPANPRRQSAHV